MTTLCYWIDDIVENFELCEKIAMLFPCFFSIENEIPLGYIEIKFICRNEDVNSIKNALAEIM